MSTVFEQTLPRFSYEPLMRLAGCTNGVQLSRHLGHDPSWVNKIKQRGGLTWTQADECAIRLGWPPSAIWPEWDQIADQAAAAYAERHGATYPPGET